MPAALAGTPDEMHPETLRAPLGAPVLFAQVQPALDGNSGEEVLVMADDE